MDFIHGRQYMRSEKPFIFIHYHNKQKSHVRSSIILGILKIIITQKWHLILPKAFALWFHIILLLLYKSKEYKTPCRYNLLYLTSNFLIKKNQLKATLLHPSFFFISSYSPSTLHQYVTLVFKIQNDSFLHFSVTTIIYRYQ